MIDDFSVCHNTTPQVGSSPSDYRPADKEHVVTLLEQNPDVVVACGAQAEACLRELWAGPLLVVPHPTYRLLTNKLYSKARKLLERGFEGRIALRQLKGRIRIDRL